MKSFEYCLILILCSATVLTRASSHRIKNITAALEELTPKIEELGGFQFQDSKDDPIELDVDSHSNYLLPSLGLVFGLTAVSVVLVVN